MSGIARLRTWLGASCLLALAACGPSDAEKIAEATRGTNRTAVPPQFVGGGADERTGRPVGYPEGVPLVEGAESLSGGVEPGVVTTAIVRYRMTRDRYLEALETALERDGFEVSDEGIGPTGAHRLRARKESRSVTFLVNEEGPATRVDVLSIEPRAPRTGTREPPR